MKRFLPVALVVVLLVSMGAVLMSGLSPKTDQDNAAVSPASAAPIFRTISAAEAAKLIKARENLEVIDVRTPQERKQFRIADTRLVPVGDVIRGVFEADPDKPLMLVCAVGGRSYVAGKVMFARGYREIYNLDGGIESWRRAGLPLETGPENPPQ
jgi:rhodanese-related sulfurtransferase